MYAIELSRTFVAIKYARLSFISLLLLLSSAISFYFFSQSAHSEISRFLPNGIGLDSKWYSLEINNNYGIKGNGFSKIKADKLIEGSQEVIKKWFITLDNGESNVKILNNNYKVFPQLYFNNAPSLVNLELYKGNLPDLNSKEVLISYDFWKTQLASSPNIINKYIEVDGSKFLISGITQKGFNSFFLNQKFDIFVDAKQWINSRGLSQSFWQVILIARPINLAITVRNNLSPEQISSKLMIVAQNLKIDSDNSSIALFEGLVGDIKYVQSYVEFSQFYYYISIAIVLLAFIAFVLYQSMHIIKQKNEFYTRFILGENEKYIILNQFIYVFFWLMVAMLLGLLIYYICLFVFKDSSLIKFLQIKTTISNLIPSLINIIILSVLVALTLGYLAIAVIHQKSNIIKKIFILLITCAMSVSIGLTSIASINKIELNNKFKNKINFQTDEIYQWTYVNKGLDSLKVEEGSNPQKDLKIILQKELKSSNDVIEILVSNITPINGYNLRGSQDIEDDGTFSIKNEYFSNVNNSYFDFFKIPIVSGNIPQITDSNNDIVINETLAKKYGGSSLAINKKTDKGERIVAVVKDAHFLNSDMMAPPFTYYINNDSRRIIILIKGKIDVSYFNDVIENTMKRYYRQYKLDTSNSFYSEYEKYFIQDFNRLLLLSLISITILIIGLFSLYSGTLQWIEINKKHIAIKFALGLTESKLWQELTTMTFYWILIIGTFSYLTLFFLLPSSFIGIKILTMFYVMVSILFLITVSIIIIYWIVLKRLNNDFLTQVL